MGGIAANNAIGGPAICSTRSLTHRLVLYFRGLSASPMIAAVPFEASALVNKQMRPPAIRGRSRNVIAARPRPVSLGLLIAQIATFPRILANS